MGQHRLSHPGDVLDQQVTAREQAGDRKADLALLAEDDAPDLGDDLLDLLRRHGALGKIIHVFQCATVWRPVTSNEGTAIQLPRSEACGFSRRPRQCWTMRRAQGCMMRRCARMRRGYERGSDHYNCLAHEKC
jgi:hypothetical protein